MDLIGPRELKEKLDRGERIKLVMCLGSWAYRAMHIPRSLCLSTTEEWLETLDPADEIVLYDSSPYCARSRRAYKVLRAHGYERVRCSAGGLEEWESMGYSLEGERMLASIAS
jgi:rhodanese-related sulfurtransferase